MRLAGIDSGTALTDPYRSGDVYAPARRALWLGPALAIVGAAIAVFGIADGGPWALLAIPGGLLVLLGLLRTVAGAAMLLVERRRKRVLREGIAATGVITASEQVRTRLGYPIMEVKLAVTSEDGRKGEVTKKGAVPPQYAGEFTVGNEVPLRVDRNDLSVAAIDWASF